MTIMEHNFKKDDLVVIHRKDSLNGVMGEITGFLGETIVVFVGDKAPTGFFGAIPPELEFIENSGRILNLK